MGKSVEKMVSHGEPIKPNCRLAEKTAEHIFRRIMPSVTITIPTIVITSHLLQFLDEAALVELNLHGSLPADHLLEVAPVHQAEVGLGLDKTFRYFYFSKNLIFVQERLLWYIRLKKSSA